MEVVRWRLAWSNCFMSLVISLTCAGRRTKHRFWSKNKDRQRKRKYLGRKKEVKVQRWESETQEKSSKYKRVIHWMGQQDKEKQSKTKDTPIGWRNNCSYMPPEKGSCLPISPLILPLLTQPTGLPLTYRHTQNTELLVTDRHMEGALLQL